MTATQTTAPQDDEIDLRELLGTLLDHKWLIGIVTGVFFVLSVGYAVLVRRSTKPMPWCRWSKRCRICRA